MKANFPHYQFSLVSHRKSGHTLWSACSERTADGLLGPVIGDDVGPCIRGSLTSSLQQDLDCVFHVTMDERRRVGWLCGVSNPALVVVNRQAGGFAGMS
jgi:hypothetical protein